MGTAAGGRRKEEQEETATAMSQLGVAPHLSQRDGFGGAAREEGGRNLVVQLTTMVMRMLGGQGGEGEVEGRGGDGEGGGIGYPFVGGEVENGGRAEERRRRYPLEPILPPLEPGEKEFFVRYFYDGGKLTRDGVVRRLILREPHDKVVEGSVILRLLSSEGIDLERFTPHVFGAENSGWLELTENLKFELKSDVPPRVDVKVRPDPNYLLTLVSNLLLRPIYSSVKILSYFSSQLNLLDVHSTDFETWCANIKGHGARRWFFLNGGHGSED